MKCVVLSAGLSTRLRLITGDIPKPTVKINGISMLERCITNLRNQGFSDIIITTHYKEWYIKECLANKFQDINLTYSYETELLDTAGSLKLLEDKLKEDFFVCGGSFFLDNQDLNNVIDSHMKSKAIATVVLWNCNETEILPYYGQAIIENNQIIGFEEKPRTNVSRYVHTTYQIFNTKIFKYYSGKESIPNLLKKLIANNQKINAYISQGNLVNISNPILYERALKYFNGKSDFNR